MHPLKGAVALTAVLVVAKTATLRHHAWPSSVTEFIVAYWQDAFTGLGYAAIAATAHRLRSLSTLLFVALAVHAVMNTALVLATGSPMTASMFGAAGSALEDSVRSYATAAILLPTGLVAAAAIALGLWAGRSSSPSNSPASDRRVARSKTAPRLDGAAECRAVGFRTVGFSAVGLGALAMWTVAGVWLESSVDTHGLHRSGAVTLVRSFFRQLPSEPTAGVTAIDDRWRQSLDSWIPPRAVASTAASSRSSSYGAPIRSDTMPIDTMPIDTIRSDPDSPDLTQLAGAAAGRHVFVVVLESVSQIYLNRNSNSQAAPPMPFLASLAARSWSASDAYAVYPESIRGLWPVLAGRYPAFETTAKRYERTRPPTLASIYSAAGYATALYHAGRFGYLGMESIIRERGFDQLIDAGDLSGIRDSSFGVDETTVVDRLLGDIERREPAQPTFAMYLPIAGHHPYDSAGGPFFGDGDQSDYLNAIHEADLAIAQLFAGLEKQGLLSNSVVAIVGDHGQAFGQHPGNFGHVFFLYEENLRVPLLIHAPGLIDDPIVQPGPVSVIDLAPTLLDLTEGRPTLGQGRSLLRAPAPRPAFFFTDYSLPLVGVRHRDWKLIHHLDSGRDELYRLSEDPHEVQNRAEESPDITHILRERALAWIRSQEAAWAATPEAAPRPNE